MKQLSPHYSYAMLFDPMIARAVVERAATWDLPRRTCRPLDRNVGRSVNAELAAYDAAIDLSPAPAGEMRHDMPDADSDESGTYGGYSDLDGVDDD